MKGNTNCLVSSGNGKVFEGEYQLQPEAATQNIIPEWSEYNGPFEDEQTGNVSYDGLSKLKVRKIGSWIDSHLSADNIRNDVSVLGVKGNLIELQGEERTVKSNTYEQTIEPSEGKNGITKVTVSPVKYQNKITNPAMTEQTVRPDDGYDAMSSVTVNAIDFDYLKEQEPDLVAGNIKKGVEIFTVVGTYEPEYNNQTKTVDPKTYAQDIRADDGYDGLSNVHVNAVTSSIDGSIKADNIRKNVNILGVTGTYEGRQPIITTVNESSIIDPKVSEQTFTVPSDTDGFDSFKVNPVTSNIDSNILPKNIKRGITILGVEGNYIPENLQSKVVNPTTAVQNVTYDDGYEGLNNVQVNAVTSTIDENITAENIKLGVSILGVDGTLEEGIKQSEVEQTKTITPEKTPVIVKPGEGFKALSQVNVEGVTAAIDTNILAENIKKGIEILGVTGTLDAQQKIIQDKKEIEPSMVQQVVTPDVGYDALLRVIVKAVTASIDPNILPKNIKKNISILGVTGTLEEGEEQKWFDFSGISGVGTMNKNIDNGGTIASIMTIIENNWELNKLFSNMPEGKVPSNINAALFDLVYGYDNLTPTDNGLEQLFIFFSGGQLYTDYSKLTKIDDQIRWLYPYTNEYGVDGCLINYTDDGTEKVLKLYVLTDSTDANQPVPVLVDGTMSASLLPEGFDGFRYVVDMTIPAHTVFNPKITLDQKLNWVLQARKGIKPLIHVNQDKPLTIDVSAYDKNFGEEDPGTSIPGSVVDFNVSPLSSNGTLGGDSFAVSANDDGSHYAYYAFDQNSDTYWRYGASSGSFTFYNPEAIIVNQILYSPYYSYPTAGEIRGSNNGSDWTTITSFTNDVNSTFAIDLSSNNTAYKYYQIYISSVNMDVIHCSEIQIKVKGKDINATSHTIYPLTKDLLFYERSNGLGNLVNYVDNGDAVDIKLYRTKGKDWAAYNRPNISSNGTFGADDLSVQVDGDPYVDYPAWKVFDGITNSGFWHANSNSSHWIKWYHTIPVKISKLKIFNGSSASSYGIKTYTLSGSNDNSSWVELTSGTNNNTSEWSGWNVDVNSNDAYSYYKLDCTSQSGDYLFICEIQIEGETVQENQDLYVFAPDENLGSEYQNVEYVDTISIPEHNIYVNEDNQWYQAKHITIDVDNTDATIYTEIEDKEQSNG